MVSVAAVSILLAANKVCVHLCSVFLFSCVVSDLFVGAAAVCCCCVAAARFLLFRAPVLGGAFHGSVLLIRLKPHC